MSLRNCLRAPLISAVAAALIGGFLTSAPASAQTSTKPDDKQVARERQAAGDSLSRSRVVFKKSSYLCIGYQACAKAGMASGGYASANDKMYWRMYAGHNCTNYAAYRMVKSGLPNARPWSGGGNATYWGTSVPQITDKVPAVGAVAWWRANTGPAGSAGHVAYVEKVVSADQIIISQDSWGGDFSWAVVTKASGNWPSGFVHFNDLKLQNKAVPVISGTAKVGARLSGTTGTWTPSDATISYQWYASGVAIPKATAATYTVASSYLRKVIRVQATATKAGYPTIKAISAGTPAVLPGVIASSVAPVVTGVAQVDQTLTLVPGKWNVTPDRTTIQWYADGVAIAGEVGTTLVVTPELVGKEITARVTAARTSYNPVTARSAATEPVRLGVFRVTARPSVTGTAKPWQILTVHPGTYRPDGAAVAVQWLRDGRWIDGARGTTYRLRPIDVGAFITAKVTVSRAGYETTNLVRPSPVRVKVTPRIRVDRVRLKHAVALRVAVSAPGVPKANGTVMVRVQGGYREKVVLEDGIARFRVSGLPQGKRVLRITYWGSVSTEPLVRVGSVRMP